MSQYRIQSLDTTCWSIEEQGVRSFLLIGLEYALLIDTGFGTGNLRDVISQLTQLPIKLVNTHTDRDHIGCNHLFQPAFMHPAEYDRYQQGDRRNDPVKPLWEGDIIHLGNRILEVILIPGHTPGSIALLDSRNRILFGGDSVQAGTIYLFGAGRNLPAYIDSMEKLLQRSDAFDKIYPSHGPIPISSAVIPGLIHGAKQILHHEVTGTDPENPNIPALLYDIGVAKFLY